MKPKHYGQEPPLGAFARLRAAATPHHAGGWMWAEAVLITLGALALAFFARYEDPFLVGSLFPWLWFAPVLVALRYGVSPGVLSSVILLCGWLIMNTQRPVSGEFPKQYFLGWLILVMICGEFSASWRTRLRRAEETNQYLDQRLARITKRHLLLSLSHERMEQELLSKPATLRDALISLRQLTVDKTADDPLAAAEPLLSLLVQHCQLEVAAIFVPAAGGKYRRVAAIGTPFELDPTDPLLAYALEKRLLAHLLTAELENMPTQNLVAAPIVTSGDVVLGVVVVNRMPFFALTTETLQMLSAMLAYYADCAAVSGRVRPFLTRFPDAPYEFAEEFVRMMRMQAATGIDSHAVVFVCGDGAGEEVAARIARVKRGLDINWLQRTGGRTVLLTLMPLAGRAAVDGYLMRIETLLREYLGGDFDTLHITPRVVALGGADPHAALAEALK
ncbi:MAG: hypothetical protein EPN14_09680 [Gallionella sp.]|nr:MAG: hypothetical protein EPN14_09680 [Gallionella sp.]